MTAAHSVLVERAEHRMVATLDRPHTRNAIDQQTVDALHEVCEELERDPKVLILAGSDGVFASGADIAELRDRTAADALAGINTRLFMRIAVLPMPVIAGRSSREIAAGARR